MRAFVVRAAGTEVELVSDVLWRLGVRGIEERPCDPPDDVTSTPPLVELWTFLGDEPEAIDRAARALEGRWDFRVVEVDSVAPDAAARWRDFASPVIVSDELVIVPAWQPFTPPVDRSPTAVRIEPGAAFGLGDHPTTLLSLRAMTRLLAGRGSRCRDVLDVGCGTGVIAVSAACLVARPVRAIDVSAAAIEATIDNARRNGVVELVEADTTDLADVAGDYDLVIANILAPVLVSLADELRRVTRPGGRLVVSGILAGAHHHVLDVLAPLETVRTDVLDGWAAVELRHP